MNEEIVLALQDIAHTLHSIDVALWYTLAVLALALIFKDMGGRK